MTIELKRFDQKQQAQVEQVIAFTRLMGLTGKDLVAIGGAIDRRERAEESKMRLAVANTITILPIRGNKSNKRFKITNSTGNYYFEYIGWRTFDIRSFSGKQKTVQTDIWENNLPKSRNEVKMCTQNICYDIATGKLILDW